MAPLINFYRLLQKLKQPIFSQMKCLLFFFAFIPIHSVAQLNVKAFVCNKKHEPLPLTNIVSIKTHNGTITDENGKFQIAEMNVNDTLKITNISYLPLLIPVSKITSNDTIFLLDNIKELDEIIVRNWNSYKSAIELGYFNYPNNGEFKLMPGNQIALYIDNPLKKEGIIKGVYFRLKQKGKCENSLRLRLSDISKLDLEPSLDILNENVIIANTELRSKNYIDLTKYRILMPQKGVFVILELLFPENNCQIKSYTSLSANLSVQKNLVWLNFRDKSWAHNNRPRLPNGNFITPNISLRVVY